MTEVTDKMVDAACSAFGFGSSNIPSDYMRSAIEAALAAREHDDAGELVNKLRHNMGYTVLSLIQERDQAADAIEKLVEALKPFAKIATELSDEIGDRKNTMHWAVPYAGDLRRALAVLTRIGVKL